MADDQRSFNSFEEADKWIERCDQHSNFKYVGGKGVAMRMIITSTRRDLTQSFFGSMGVTEYMKLRSKVAWTGKEYVEPSRTVKPESLLIGGPRSCEHNKAMYGTALLKDLGLISLSTEYKVGHPGFLIRRFTHINSNLKSMVGSIDEVCYNKDTGNIVLIDYKTTNTENCKNKPMKPRFCTSTNIRQLTIYAMLLRRVAFHKKTIIPIIDYLLIIAIDNVNKSACGYIYDFLPEKHLSESIEYRDMFDELTKQILK